MTTETARNVPRAAPASGGRVALGALLVAGAMALVVGGALAFEHLGGYIPCALCLQQRIPYYAGVPVALLAAGAAWLGRRGLAMMLLLAVVVLMAYGAYLGAFHSGVEWGWWPGPADCGTTAAGAGSLATDDLLGALDSVRPPSCDEAAGRFAGLSFAGWQTIAATGFAVVTIALVARARGGPGRPA